MRCAARPSRGVLLAAIRDPFGGPVLQQQIPGIRLQRGRVPGQCAVVIPTLHSETPGRERLLESQQIDVRAISQCEPVGVPLAAQDLERAARRASSRIRRSEAMAT